MNFLSISTLLMNLSSRLLDSANLDTEDSPTSSVDSDSGCGYAYEERIVGGDEASANSWPWMASLETIYGRHFCGATLVSSRHLVTAGHCLGAYAYAPFFIRVILGSPLLGTGSVHFVRTVSIHPEFRTGSYYDSDIAILTLTKAVSLKEQRKSVCLPDKPLRSDDSETPLTVLGWGHQKEGGKIVKRLREASLKRLQDSKCQVYGDLWQPDKMLCVGWPSGGRDACKGDSGGPLLQQDEGGRWKLYGLVSYGKGCGKAKFPGVYTDVFRFKDWMKTVIAHS